MGAADVAFAVIAASMVAGAVGVVTVRNVVHAALFLVLVLGGVAGQYLLLSAEFVAWVQVLVYIGAVIVLFLFGIMLTRAPLRNDPGLDNDQRAGALIVSAGLLALLVSLLVRTFGSRPVGLEEPVAKAADVADSIFLTYVIPFELVSVLLLVALIGSIVLARKD